MAKVKNALESANDGEQSPIVTETTVVPAGQYVTPEPSALASLPSNLGSVAGTVAAVSPHKKSDFV